MGNNEGDAYEGRRFALLYGFKFSDEPKNLTFNLPEEKPNLI